MKSRICTGALGGALFFALTIPSHAQPQPGAPEPRCELLRDSKLVPIAPTHMIPPYPGLSQKLNESGTTSLRVTIAPDGSASAASVLIPTGYPRLDEQAVSYVKANWRWQPLSRPCVTNVNVVWNLHPGAEDRDKEQGPTMSLAWDLKMNTDGAAALSIKLDVPPGTQGIDPGLTLMYGSRDGEYVMGPGWTIRGLPSVEHCNRARQFFCMSGKHLVAIKGAYGAEGTEYRNQVEIFTRMITHGAVNGEPEWFEMRYKDGSRQEYGRTPDSREIDPVTGKIRAWRLSQESDFMDTYIAYRYEPDPATGALRPVRIDYSGNTKAQLAPANSVRFAYAGNTPQRLEHIQTFVAEKLVSDYRLGYAASGTAASSVLKTVTRCDAQGLCLAPLSLGWREFTAGTKKIPLVIELHNGIGQHAFMNYAPPPAGRKDDRPGYPDLVVTSIEFTDPNGQRVPATYSYEGDPIYDDEDFLGFTKETKIVGPEGLKVVTTYSADPGSLSETTSEISTLNGILQESIRNEWAYRSDYPGVYFTYAKKITKQVNDLDGTPEWGSEVTAEYDAYGDLLREITKWGDGSSMTEENTYWTDASRWILGKLLTIHVTKTPAAPALDRESSFQYDRNTGLLTQEVIEPRFRPYRVQTDYSHDDFGHRVEKRVSAASITPQVFKFLYDARGVFVVEQTGPEGRTVTTTDPATGAVLTKTGNGRSERRSYDGLGRLIQYVSGQIVGNYRYGYCRGINGGDEDCPQYGATFIDEIGTDPDSHRFNFYNARGRIIATELRASGKRKIMETWKYDYRDNLIQFCRNEMGDGLICSDRTYDGASRMTRMTWPEANVSWRYHGLTSVRTDSSGNVLTIVKDAFDHILSQTSKSAQGEKTITNVYDGWGHRVESTDTNGGVRKFTYDLSGQPVRDIEPDGIVISYGPPN